MLSLIYLLFTVSGACGLIYQVAWTRLLGHVFGTTVYAVTTVLTVFLGGLALGAYWLGRRADRSSRPLRLYGWLEVGIGVAALFAITVLDHLTPAYLWLTAGVGGSRLAVTGVRFLLAAVAMLPATVLMGATLPVLSRFVLRRLSQVGGQLSLLYALNTFGAVAGTVAAGFWLLGAIGIHPTIYLAMAGNLAVGSAAWLLARRAREQEGRVDTAPLQPKRQARGPVPVPVGVGSGLLLVVGLSGFASLGLEVLWTRALVIVVGSSTYAFTTMLAAFLVGITVGSMATRLFVDRLRDPRRFFGWVELTIAVSAMVTLPILQTIMPGGVVYGWLQAFSGSWLGLVAQRFGVAFGVMLVTTVLIGTTFPLAGKMWVTDLRAVGREVGVVYGANTAGNIVGAFLTGFVILPLAGIQLGVVLLALLSLVAALWGLWPARTAARHWRPVAAGALYAAVAVAVMLGRFTTPGEGEQPGDRTLFYREGIAATVKVVAKAYDPTVKKISVDGTNIGSNEEGLDLKQQVLAHLPFVLRPDTRNVLSIGLGSGILIGEVGRRPQVKEAVCVEIAPSVIAAAREFDGENHDLFGNDRIHVVEDDGINFLLRNRRQYDAIISDAKSRPEYSSNASFFSREYYELARKRLSDHGLLVQWVPLHLPPEDYQVVLHTFASVFPEGGVWHVPPGNSFLVGSKTPVVVGLARAQEEWSRPYYDRLRAYGINSPETLIGCFVTDWRGLRQRLLRVQTNSLEHPLLEFYSLEAYRMPKEARVWANTSYLVGSQKPIGAALRFEDESARAAVSEVAAGWRTYYEGVGLLGYGVSRLGDARRLFDQAMAMSPTNGRIRHVVADKLFEIGVAALNFTDDLVLPEELLLKAVDLRPGMAQAWYHLGVVYDRKKERAQAALAFEKALAANPQLVWARQALAEVGGGNERIVVDPQ